jgi:hypothetical protein
MLCGVEIAVCSDVNTKHINKEREIFQFLSFKPVGARKQ